MFSSLATVRHTEPNDVSSKKNESNGFKENRYRLSQGRSQFLCGFIKKGNPPL